jgi:putative endonuclease
MKFYYVYVLLSLKDSRFYTGYTKDLKERLKKHNNGQVASTAFRRPFHLIYFEGCRNKDDALHREKYLKTTYGKRYLRNRLKSDLGGK